MQELISASLMRTPAGMWRVKIKFLGSYIEQDYTDRRVAWEYVLGWLSGESDNESTV